MKPKRETTCRARVVFGEGANAKTYVVELRKKELRVRRRYGRGNNGGWMSVPLEKVIGRFCPDTNPELFWA